MNPNPIGALGLFTRLPLILFAAWGIGALIAAIGKIRGWNTKRTFWVSVISYALLEILLMGVGLIDELANAFLDIETIFVSTLVQEIILIIVFILNIIGMVLAPLALLILRSRHSDVFKNSKTGPVTPISNPPLAIERQPSGLGNILRSRPESVAPAFPEPNVYSGSGHIFVSYRRSDSADVAGRIYDRLIGRFGRQLIFKDVDSIPLGLDFKKHLEQKVGECDVMLAIIGDRWIEASDSTGSKRLEDPADFVRIEIETALERDIPVIPLLVRDAHMPSEESLPSSLRNLAFRNGIPIRSDPDFHRDMDRLIAALEKYIR